jgi:hypothetical protein
MVNQGCKDCLTFALDSSDEVGFKPATSCGAAGDMPEGRCDNSSTAFQLAKRTN